MGSIGARLREAGLTARALAAWAATARIAALPARLAAMPARPPTPAGALLALFVGGVEISAEGWARVATGVATHWRRTADAAPVQRPDLLDELLAHQLLERDGDRIRARVAILPVGQALLVADRIDAPVERDLVCWPDDSSHHLATAIPPGRRTTWLDLGCGSAFAPLSRPELASRITGIDINERAVRHAALGAQLSGITHLVPSTRDAGALHEAADLVTCNAPIPGAPGAHTAGVSAVWRRAEPGFFERLWPALRAAVRPGGMIVVHAALEVVAPALASAGGERVVVTYTPDGAPGFAVAWWCPDAPDRLVTARRALTPERPHVDPRDREDALVR